MMTEFQMLPYGQTGKYDRKSRRNTKENENLFFYQSIREPGPDNFPQQQNKKLNRQTNNDETSTPQATLMNTVR